MENLIKICGLSTPEGVHAASENGATHLGFIFFEKSPRHVQPKQAAELIANVHGIETVAGTVNADDEYLDEIVNTMKPSMLQLHGKESLERVAQVKQRYSLPVIKAFAVSSENDVAAISSYAPIVDLLLVDAKPPKGSKLPGGNGVSFNWSLLDQLQTAKPVLLSGGIDMDNVMAAMDHVLAEKSCVKGIDVSSGVESAPGVKEISKIEGFLAQCRHAIASSKN